MVIGLHSDIQLKERYDMPKTNSLPWQYKDPTLQVWPNNGRIVVFDLEFTAWEGSLERGWSEEWEHREIVQIGALLVDAAALFEQIDSFSRFVKPTRNTQLSNYFTTLTGIDQITVDKEGFSFVEAYSEFVKFVEDADVLFANGTDGEVLRENCALNDLEYGFEHGRVVNIRSQIAGRISEQVGEEYVFVDSGDLTNVLGCSSSNEIKHNALADAKEIALTLRELRRRNSI
jgi:inhibitor of KinA sporulation pathway (predicted exonuclease)